MVEFWIVIAPVWQLLSHKSRCTKVSEVFVNVESSYTVDVLISGIADVTPGKV